MNASLRRRWLATRDWAPLLVPLLGLVAVWPLLTQSLPSTDDGAFHMLRLVELDRCLRHGVLPLRWAPDMAHGYGYPFYNYYASLSSYIAELWHLAGLTFPQAVAAATVCAYWVSGWGAYLVGRDSTMFTAADRGRTPRHEEEQAPERQRARPRLANQLAGLVAATAYMYAPYQFYDSAYRGNLAETWALAILPWVLWTARRAVCLPRVADAREQGGLDLRWARIVPLALCYAALIYTHNVYALISSPVVVLYLALLWQREGQGTPLAARLREGLRLVAALGLGLALSAFFWLPAFGERGWTRYSTGLVDYRTFFLTPRELLALPPQLDLSRLNPYPPRSLSWGMIVLAGSALALLAARALRARPRRSAPRDPTLWETLFFLVVSSGAAFLTLRASDTLWRTIPLLVFAQIPWRFLGIASLCGGLVAAALPVQLTSWMRTKAATGTATAAVASAAGIVLLVATAIPWTYAAPFPQHTGYSVRNILAWEYKSGLIGTTAQTEFLPAWSGGLPPEPADARLLDEGDAIAARLDLDALPEGARLVEADYRLMRASLVVESPEPFRARYKQFTFPGWKVLVDGREVAQVATAPYGLLSFDVPAGRHTIVVRPTTTPLRLVGSLISILALAGTAAIVGQSWMKRRRARHADRESAPVCHREERQRPLASSGSDPLCTPQEEQRSGIAAAEGQRTPKAAARNDSGKGLCSGRTPGPTGKRGCPATARRPSSVVYLAFAGLALLLLLAKEGWIDQAENVFRARRYEPGVPGGNIPGTRVDTAINFGNAYTLYGYDLPRQPTVAGEPLRVDLYVGARQPPEARQAGDYRAYARLVDEQGGLWSLPDNDAPEGHRPPPPTEIWPMDAYGHWAYLVQTLPGTPPGQYWIQVGLFEEGTWAGLNVLDEAGQIAYLSTRIGPVEIVRPRRPPDLATLDLDRTLSVTAAPGLRLLGAKAEQAPQRAGDTLSLALYWQAETTMRENYALSLALCSGDERLLLGDGLPLGRADHPTAGWTEGEVVRSLHTLRVPASVPAGAYSVEATVRDRAHIVVSGKLKAVARGWATPQGIKPVDANLGGQITLLGYVEDREGQVILYWQAQREIPTSYKVFVQWIGAGQAIAQHDAVPGNWQRPTTGWMPGEVVADAHALALPDDLPPGEYTLIAGMYDEATLLRVPLLDSSGAVMADHVVLKRVALK